MLYISWTRRLESATDAVAKDTASTQDVASRASEITAQRLCYAMTAMQTEFFICLLQRLMPGIASHNELHAAWDAAHAEAEQRATQRASLTLTDNEKLVLNALMNNNYGEGGTGTWAWAVDQTNSGTVEFTLAKKSIPGVIASLVKKGVVTCETGETKKEDAIYVTPAGREYAVELGYWEAKYLSV